MFPGQKPPLDVQQPAKIDETSTIVRILGILSPPGFADPDAYRVHDLLLEWF
jgi:hypothetical protein